MSTKDNAHLPTNILIVGNGFDLAHELPTTYKDFFNILSINKEMLTSDTNKITPQEKYSTICDAIIKFKRDCETHSIDYDDISNSEETLNFYKKLRDNKILIDNKIIAYEVLRYFEDIKNYNMWYKLIENKLHQYDEKWVDFEKLIKNVIKIFDKDAKTFLNKEIISHLNGEEFLDKVKAFNKVVFLDGPKFYTALEQLDADTKELLKSYFDEKKITYSKNFTIKHLYKNIIPSLNKSIIEFLNKNDKSQISAAQEHKVGEQNTTSEASELNIFKLTYFMKKSLDEFTLALEIYIFFIIKKISIKPVFNFDSTITPAHIISFNYTDTYRRIYKNFSEMKTRISDENIDFVHGEAGKNNLVLGIDEYLPDEDKNSNLYFVRFKKYFQRIYKKTGCKYKKWLEKINENYLANVYIIGHSLDQTDKDILRDIILHENVTTTIFYYSPEAYDEQIVNMIKLIGQDKLIDMVYGENPKIIFRDQKEIMLDKQKTAI